MSTALVNAMADLEETALTQEVKTLQTQGVPALEIIQKLQEGMNIVGKRYEEKEYYLSELIMSAEIFKEAAGLRQGTKILIGGGPCDQTTATYVGADAYCKTAQDSVEYAKKLLGVKA